MEQDYTSLDIASALLKMAMEAEGKEYAKETEVMIQKDEMRKAKSRPRFFGPRRRRR